MNLPKDVYTDPSVAREAHDIAAAAEPIVLDLVLDLDSLIPEDATEITAEILVPAFETAIADLIEENPELADQMPDLPTSLEQSVNAVVEQLHESMGAVDDANNEGSTWAHAFTNGSSYLDTME